LKDRTIVPELLADLRAGLISQRCTAFILAGLALPMADLLAWLHCADDFERTLGPGRRVSARGIRRSAGSRGPAGHP